MKRLKSQLSSFAPLFVTITVLAACSLFTPKNVQTALDIAKVLCIVANAESDDQTVKAVCNILDAEQDAFKSILTQQRAASRRYASTRAACSPGATDAGSDAK